VANRLFFFFFFFSGVQGVGPDSGILGKRPSVAGRGGGAGSVRAVEPKVDDDRGGGFREGVRVAWTEIAGRRRGVDVGKRDGPVDTTSTVERLR